MSLRSGATYKPTDTSTVDKSEAEKARQVGKEAISQNQKPDMTHK